MKNVPFSAKKEFSKLMNSFFYKHGSHQAFDDFLQAAICAFHPATLRRQIDEGNEKTYFEAIGRYGKEEVDMFVKLMGLLIQNAAENPYDDLLGSYYEEFLSMGHNGQYFTPAPIAYFMAQITIGNNDEEAKTVLDPACGSGIMLLSAAKVNPKNVFFGYDLDKTCAMMTALNFMVNGMEGEVGWCNSLSYTSIYATWHINAPLGIMPIPVEKSRLYQANEATMEILKLKQIEQFAKMKEEEKARLEEKQLKQVMKQGIKKMQVAENQINIFGF